MRVQIVPFLSLCVCCLFAGRAHADRLTLRPSDICDALAHAASRIEIRDSRHIAVETGTTYDWPGITVFFREGEAFGVHKATLAPK